MRHLATTTPRFLALLIACGTAASLALPAVATPTEAARAGGAKAKRDAQPPRAEADRRAPQWSAKVEREAQRIEKLLVAPCCFKGTLEDHTSAVADQMRLEIRQRLQAGHSRARILAHFEKQHGRAVLADPPKSGLSKLVLYGVPFVVATLLILVATVIAAGRRSSAPTGPPAPLPGAHPLPDELGRRIDGLVDRPPAV